MPHVIEFVTGAEFLDQTLYPRQATLLKLMFCESQLLTGYDRDVMGEWASGFALHRHSDGTIGYRGGAGVVPDVVERMESCRLAGRRWFREVVMVGGRRGSKGFLGAVATAYVLWHQLARPDPAAHYGISRGKQVHVLVFAGQRDQAVTNQWRDLADVIRLAPCFRPFVAKEGRDTLWLYSSAQRAAGNVDPDDAAFKISAKEATTLAGRGPAAIVQIFDEMAHMAAGGANRPAEEIFSSATPALAQFSTDSFLYEASSPWQQQGQFFANYRRGLAVDPGTGLAVDPDMLVVQFPSQELYRDWELTLTGAVAAWPDGPPLSRRERPIFDAADADRLRRADPHGFDVEYGAHWATSVAAYLLPEDVDAVFAPWPTHPLQNVHQGRLGTRYVAHADPSVSGANFAVVVAHREGDDQSRGHVVVDHVRVWRPSDFPDGRIEYETVTEVLESLIVRFRISSLTMDQFNSAGLMAQLKAYARTHQLQQQTMISERTATGPSNQRMSENLKTAMSRRLVHSPHHDLLEAELRNLEIRNGRVDHPTRGPVQTSDVADCLMNVVDALIGDGNSEQFTSSLGAITLSGSRPAHPLAAAFDTVHHARGVGLSRGAYRDPARGGRVRRRGRP